MQDRPTAVGSEAAEQLSQLVESALFEIKRVVAGQDAMLERVLVCLLAEGHLLIEGVPGLAKTLTIRTTAHVLGGTFGRVILSGNGSISLSPATTGMYANLLVFQSRDNPKAMTLSGSGIAVPGGAIYAPAAATDWPAAVEMVSGAMGARR